MKEDRIEFSIADCHQIISDCHRNMIFKAGQTSMEKTDPVLRYSLFDKTYYEPAFTVRAIIIRTLQPPEL